MPNSGLAIIFSIGKETDLEVVFSQVVKGKGLCSTFSLIIATPLSYAVDISPVCLLLWVLQGIAIHLYESNFNISSLL